MSGEQTLLELAARCEAATGPDRELSIAVLLAVGWQRYSRNEFIRPDGMFVNSAHLPDPLASLDAAMALVPEGMQWFKERGTYVPNIAVIQGPICSFVGETDTTFALALCAASLRARANG